MNCPTFAFLQKIIQKILLFKLFTDLTVQEFDEIYAKIERKYEKYEIKHLSKKEYRERGIGAGGRNFNLDVKNRFLMFLVYHHLYITYTLRLSP